MAQKARHAFGSSSSIEQAKANNKIDAFDILFLDGDTEPKIGWLDANGNTVICKDKEQVIRVTELPNEDGDKSVIYIYNNEGYIWNGVECVAISKSADLSALEEEIDTKVTAEEVKTMIQESGDSLVEIVEF